MWTSTLGFEWTPLTARWVAFLLGLAGLLLFLCRPLERWHKRIHQLKQNFLWYVLFGFILILAIVTRHVQIRFLVLPNWVDSVHHTMVTLLLLDSGSLPTTYDPYIPDGRFFYHWGFHAHLVWLNWLLGDHLPVDVAKRMLLFGQILNVLSAVMLYAVGRILFQSRRAGLLTAVFGTLVSWYPAYYASWGRYTQLTGVLVLLPLFVVFLRFHQFRSWRTICAAAFLASGLFLIHVRIAFLACILFMAVILWIHIGSRAKQSLGRWICALILTGLIVLPWLYRLLNNPRLQQILTTSTAETQQWWSTYNEIPWTLVWSPRNHELLALATGGMSGLTGWGEPPAWLRIASAIWSILLLTFIGHAALRLRWSIVRQRLFMASGIVYTWCAFTAILLNLDKLELPSHFTFW
ncbi:hypothetical protein KFU94_13745 [Chloroflexi bacterium TSY]|nr:hypothetical protein [Chloroflexi bacterium TSY]MBV7329283.1 hypothetical protein [Chloroflexi bacterium TSY]